MGTKDFTEDNHGSRLDGARACLETLRGLESAAVAAGHPDTTWEEHWEAKRAAADTLIRASGVTSPYLAGFLAVLAEHVDFCTTMGTPNLAAGGWMPSAAMNAVEFGVYRRAVEADASA